MKRELEAIVRDGEKILRITRPADRQRSWRAWRNRISAVIGDAEDKAEFAIQLKPDTLAQDLRSLKEFTKRLAYAKVPIVAEKTSEAPETPTPTAQPKQLQDQNSIGVFISHRARHDQEVASTIRDKLRILSHGKVESFMFEKMRGGEDWYQWVEDNISKSKVLLLLYTDDEMDLRWCLYEAGLFRGFQSKELNLICLKNTNIPAPPNPLQRFQSYNANEEGLENFLTDFLYRGSFTGGEPINSDLLDDDKEEFARAVGDIKFLFEERQIHRNYFRKRLEVVFSDPEARDGNENGRNNDRRSLRGDVPQLAGAKVEAGELTRDLLDLPYGELVWRDVQAQLIEKGHHWVTEVPDAVQAIRDNKPIRQVLTSFNSSAGRICLPLLSRVEHVKNRPKLLSVIFVETEVVEKGAEHADSLARAPQPLMTIVQLLNLARRFRWNILEHFIAKMGHPDVQGEELGDLMGDLMESFTRLEKEAEEQGYLQLDAIAASLTDVPKEVIAKIFEDFFSDRALLMEAISNQSKDEVVSRLKNLRRINKKFLILALAEYNNRIAKLEPADMRDLSDAMKN